MRFTRTSISAAGLSILALLFVAGCGGATPAAGSGGSPSSGGEGTGGAASSGGMNASGGSMSGGSAHSATGCDGCVGLCSGNACMGEYTCDSAAACDKSLAQYCGCDGVTFQASGNCPNRPWRSKGPCPEAGLPSCDPAEITCQTFAPPEECPAGQVHSVSGNCYGPCVPIEQCNCSSGQACPNENEYVCWQSAGHCGPYVR